MSYPTANEFARARELIANGRPHPDQARFHARLVKSSPPDVHWGEINIGYKTRRKILSAHWETATGDEFAGPFLRPWWVYERAPSGRRWLVSLRADGSLLVQDGSDGNASYWLYPTPEKSAVIGDYDGAEDQIPV